MTEVAISGPAASGVPGGSALAIRAEQQAFSHEQVAALKKMNGWEEVPAAELSVFFHQAQRTGLDPFAKQIYFIGRKNNRRGGRLDFTIQTSIDGMRLVADRTGRYAGSDRPRFGEDNGDKYAEVTVWKIVGGERVAFTGVAYEVEYRQEYSPMWKKMPRTMLAKCAEAQALRKAFPADLSGIYGSEEMDQAGEPVNAPEELGASVDEDGQVLDVSHEPEPESKDEDEAIDALADDHRACMEDITRMLADAPVSLEIDAEATLEYASRSYEHAVATERRLRAKIEEAEPKARSVSGDSQEPPSTETDAGGERRAAGDLPITRKQLNYLETLVADVVEDGVSRFEEMVGTSMSDLTREEASEWIGRLSGRVS